MNRFVSIGLTVLALLPLRMDSRAIPHRALAALPAEMVWAWERAEDLRWLPADVGVAYVASAVLLRGDEALVRRRTASLQLASHSALVPVVHVDMTWRPRLHMSERQSEGIAREVLRVTKYANRKVVQLDFEVGVSQRPFLAKTIATIRRQLAPDIALSVTALSSWCLDDYWMEDVRADEIVPMAFRMGPEQDDLRQRISVQQGFTRKECSRAIGFTSDEPLVAVSGRRQYYFSPKAWTAASWQAMQQTPRVSNSTLTSSN